MNLKLTLASLLSVAAVPPASAQPAPPPTADDLAKAADATAEAAAVPAPGAGSATPAAPAAEPAPAAAGADVDLAALGLDPSGASAFDDKLNIYGFADFTWQNVKWMTANPYVKDTTTFMTGRLNVYIAKNLAPHWRTLVEVRFMATPNGASNPDGTTSVTTAPDPANYSRPTEWGGTQIERAYVEYDVNSHLTVRAGHWLTPYGIWNTDHGSPVIISTARPYTIGDAWFPEHQTGLDFLGAVPIGEAKLEYHATVSNGRSATELTTDTDRRPAFGGRLALEAPAAGTLKVGISGYEGRSTGVTTSLMVPAVSFDEQAFAADAQWDHGGLHLQAEMVTRHRSFVAGHAPFTLTGMPQADGTDFGYYGLAGYRFDRFWNVMPYAIFEDYRPLQHTTFGSIIGATAGLNFRPTPTTVLKVEGIYAMPGSDGLITSDILLLTTQAAWVF